LTIVLLPTRTKIWKLVEFAVGIVENVNVAPPFVVVGRMKIELVEVTAKSLATPVVKPDASLTVIEQIIGIPMR